MFFRVFIVVMVLLVGFGMWNMLDYRANVAENKAFTLAYVSPPKESYIDATGFCNRSDLNPVAVDWCAKYPEMKASWEKAHPATAIQAQKRAEWEKSH